MKYVGALRCSRAVIPFMKKAGWGRIINISGGNARNAGNLSGGARNAGLVHMTKTLAVQLGRHGITVNCIHPGTTRTERTPSLLAARATQLGVSPDEAEKRDFAPDSPRGNAICRMVDASEVAFVAVFLASEKAWAVSGERSRQAAAPGGRCITEQIGTSAPGTSLETCLDRRNPRRSQTIRALSGSGKIGGDAKQAPSGRRIITFAEIE